MTRRAVALGLLAVGLACARPGSPPGGEPDQSPPRVVEVEPAPYDTVTDLDFRVVIRFDERISERLEGVAEIGDAVLVSPATSPVEARRKSRSIQVSMVEGWEPDLVYRVVLRPVFRDLFGNRREEPVELVFSTGAPIPESALAGFVTDRLTGQPEGGVRVEAVRSADGRTYVAETMSDGFFGMRYTPPGSYRVRAWLDQDRDRIMDFFEVQDSTGIALAEADTGVVELALLPSDTTPARLANATALDTARVRLLFDDYFAVGPIDAGARLYRLPDTTFLADGRLLHGSALDSLRAAEAEQAAAAEAARAAEAAESGRAAGDTVPAEPAAAPDTVGQEVPARPIDPGVRPGPGGGEQRTGASPLPSQELIFLPEARLEPDSMYLVVVEGVTNIQGVPGGGGTDAFEGPEPPEPDTVGVPADTLPVPGDTVPVPPDTVPPDTVPPDTLPGRP